MINLSPCCSILNLCPETLVHRAHLDTLRINWHHYLCGIIWVELLLMLFYLHVLICLDHLIHSVNLKW
jgi:hypothetical protein